MMIDTFFFFNDTATTEIYTLSLHDALPISFSELMNADPEAFRQKFRKMAADPFAFYRGSACLFYADMERSEEHTSELQSRQYLVCRLLLEKKQHPTRLHPILPSYYFSFFSL